MKLRVLPLLVAPLLLAGCANDWDVQSAAGMPAKGDAFARALHKVYVERAQFEHKEVDWDDVKFFTLRARAAGDGMPPKPQVPAERGLGANADVKANYDRLTAALATNAPQETPEACANAQAWFEHWMEQLEEGHQPDHIAEAKTNFDANMPKCVARPKIAKRFTIYFDMGKSDLTPEARKIMKDIVADQAAVKPTNIYLAGHTDTVGSVAFNEKLSAARVETVAKGLAGMGVATKALDLKHLGESSLAVPTADETAEQRNRRVEVFYEK